MLAAILTYNGFVEILGIESYKLTLNNIRNIENNRNANTVQSSRQTNKETSSVLLSEPTQSYSVSPPTKEPPLENSKNTELELWKKTEELNTIMDFENYMIQHPDGSFVSRARQHIAHIRLTQRKKIVSDIQTELNKRGCDAGLVDGLVGPSTEKAIETYRDSNKSFSLQKNEPSRIRDHLKQDNTICPNSSNYKNLRIIFLCSDGPHDAFVLPLAYGNFVFKHEGKFITLLNERKKIDKQLYIEAYVRQSNRDILINVYMFDSLISDNPGVILNYQLYEFGPKFRATQLVKQWNGQSFNLIKSRELYKCEIGE